MTPRTRSARGAGAALREEILDAATALLTESGDETAVSVRAIAARVGVSTPALYLHFADRQALMDAVCERVWASLDQAMEEAAATATTAMEGLKQRGIAYVQFGLANPEHYRIVMMDRRMSESAKGSGAEMTSDLEVASSAFSHLLESVRACIDDGVFPGDSDGPPDLTRLGIQLWATAHGITSLIIAKPQFPWPDIDDLVADVIDSIGIGIAAKSRLGDSDMLGLAVRLDRLRD